MNALLNLVPREMRVQSHHPLVELLLLTLTVWLVWQWWRRARGTRAKTQEAATGVEQMPSLEEQERRLAAFQSKPFRAECSVTSNVVVPGFAGMFEVVARDGCHITVKGGPFARATTCLDLATYDYHSFSTHPDVVDVARQTVADYGVGSCGPRGFYGTIKPHAVLEEDLTKFLGTEDCAVYSFAYATVSTLISCFAGRGDYLVVDDMVNPAVMEGCLLSRANMTQYAHNDMAALESALRAIAANDNAQHPKRRFVITEGVFQNLGDICDLPRTLELCHTYKFRLLLDDSYGFGALGRTGRGTPEHYGIAVSDVDVYVGSMSTALGGVGGFCAGEANMVDFQRLGASAYVFSASLPPYIAACGSKVLAIMNQDQSFVVSLQRNAGLVRGMLRQAAPCASAIRFIECRDDVSPVVMMQVTAEYLAKHGTQTAETRLQQVVSAMHEAKVLILRHVYDAAEPVKKVPSLRIIVKGQTKEAELKDAVKTLIAAITTAFAQ